MSDEEKDRNWSDYLSTYRTQITKDIGGLELLKANEPNKALSVDWGVRLFNHINDHLDFIDRMRTRIFEQAKTIRTLTVRLELVEKELSEVAKRRRIGEL